MVKKIHKVCLCRTKLWNKALLVYFLKIVYEKACVKIKSDF